MTASSTNGDSRERGNNEVTARQARHRAPTLMAGGSGGPGAVQVWAPDLRRLRWSTGVAAASIVAYLWITFAWAWPLLLPASIIIPLLAAWLISSFIALRRPGYLTTDGDGIALITGSGSLALQWREIKTALYKGGDYHDSLVLNAPEPIEIDLAGFRKEDRDALLLTVVERANMEPHGALERYYTRIAVLPSGVDEPRRAVPDTKREQQIGQD